MPIKRHYEGETFVAFLDVAGFRKIMEKGERDAVRTLNKFYATIFNETGNFNRRVGSESSKTASIVVSDCAVLFLNNTGLPRDMLRDFGNVLCIVRNINHRLIRSLDPSDPAIMTSCSIAYGRFSYRKTFELSDMSKNYFIGWPYVKAFSDNEYGEPRIQPGQCRVLNENLELPTLPSDPPFTLLERNEKYSYFYWMLNRPADIAGFKQRYNGAWEGVYREVIELLRNASRREIE